MIGKIIKAFLAILFFICLADLPYGLYQFVRFVVLIGFVILAYQVSEKENKTEMMIYICLALLFQPFFKVSLGREIWNVVDVIVGLALLVSIFIKIKILTLRKNAFVKENYSRMSDEELIRLSHDDGKDLSTEAISALYKEFLKRKLDISIFPSLRAHKTGEHQRHLQNVQEAKDQKYAASIWSYCFEAKNEGKTDGEIFQGLLKLGLDTEQSSSVINSMESHAKEIEKDSDNEMLTGGAICLLGILVAAIIYSSDFHRIFLTVWAAIILGAIRFFIGLNHKSKFEKILRNIQAQKQEATI